MSSSLIDRNPDLRRLREEGLAISVLDGRLHIQGIPFVTKQRSVARGDLLIFLALAGDKTRPPPSHAATFVGGMPCDHTGKMLGFARPAKTGPGRFVLCAKPIGREFADHHEMATTFVRLISGHAQIVNPGISISEPTFIAAASEDTAFRYVDTATARAGLGELSQRLAGGSVAIVGLGGTGSYVLDLIAKTPVERIHLFDDDEFQTHNAFRAPGAPSIDELREARPKVEHFAHVYGRMHAGVIPHCTRIDARSLHLLDHVDFAFLCMDDTSAKPAIIAHLERRDVAFIDVGMGLFRTDTGLMGTLRVTSSTPSKRDHVRSRGRIPLGGGGDDPYAENIQVADLNMLNAALAVLRYKRMRGFYADLGGEHFSAYSIDGNVLFNEDHVPPHLETRA